jgi:F-type H+-transporting ATPase subunit a
MHEGHGFSWISLLPVVGHWPTHIATALIICLLLLVTTLLARTKLVNAMASSDGGIVPPPKMNLMNFFEIVAENLYSLTESVIGHHDAPVYFPLVGTIFVFIFTCNLIGLIPGFQPPTDNLNTTLALGMFVFIYYNWVGFKSHGIGYIKHFFGPVWWLAWLIMPIEIMSNVVRPFSLALRLRGNIMGDHVVLGVFSDLVPILLPVIFYGLGVFVAFMQAFVFTLLTMVYISLSTAHDH